jgi:FtsZ-binding cell division protein ZapB
MVEVSALASAVIANGAWRRRISNNQIEAENKGILELKVESNLLRQEMKDTRIAMTRLEVRIEQGEKSDERVRQEMHALSGRVDAVNATYTEILQKAKDREAKAAASQAVVSQVRSLIFRDQTKITVKKEDKK